MPGDGVSDLQIAVAVALSLFTVNERDLAIKLQLGKVVESGYEPGLHFKIPVMQNVRKFPRRILTIEDSPDRVFTAEKKALKVDFFVKWRIVDVETFYETSRGEQVIAAQRLLEIVKDGLRAEFAKRTVPEVVAAERRALMGSVLSKASSDAGTLGIEVIDVRVKRIEFSEEVSESVFSRMRQERARIPEFRSRQFRHVEAAAQRAAQESGRLQAQHGFPQRRPADAQIAHQFVHADGHTRSQIFLLELPAQVLIDLGPQ